MGDSPHEEYLVVTKGEGTAEKSSSHLGLNSRIHWQRKEAKSCAARGAKLYDEYSQAKQGWFLQSLLN
jgi:hypothetical protein